MKIRAFITHKLAERFEDCQDRFAIDNGSIAVSDGMSQSVFQKIWADLLTRKFVEISDWVPNHGSISKLAIEWRKSVSEHIEKLRNEDKLHWRVEKAAQERTAGATFCGIRFKDANTYEYDVLGDTCIIELTADNDVKDIITSQATDAFDNYPDYFDSGTNFHGKGQIKHSEAKLNAPILMVSDPFSDLLSSVKGTADARSIVEKLLSVKSHEDFECVVDTLRTNFKMHNDDSTLVIIEPDGQSEFQIEHQDNLEQMIRDEELKQKEAEPAATTQSEDNAPTTPMGTEVAKTESEDVKSATAEDSPENQTEAQHETPEPEVSGEEPLFPFVPAPEQTSIDHIDVEKLMEENKNLKVQIVQLKAKVSKLEKDNRELKEANEAYKEANEAYKEQINKMASLHNIESTQSQENNKSQEDKP